MYMFKIGMLYFHNFLKIALFKRIMSKKKYKQKRAKKKKNRKRGKGKHRGRSVGGKPTALEKVMVYNDQYLLERVLSYLSWGEKKKKNFTLPSHFGVSHHMMACVHSNSARDHAAFSLWFETCCDENGAFTFNGTRLSEDLFRKVVWKNYYNGERTDEIIQACRSGCFASKHTSHQKVKSLRRNYTMLMLFSSDLLTSVQTHPVLAKYAYHLVGQWMVGHVKDWSKEVHKMGFFGQLREVFYFWTKAQKLGFPLSFRAKVTAFDWYSKAILKDFKAKDLKYKNFI